MGSTTTLKRKALDIRKYEKITHGISNLEMV